MASAKGKGGDAGAKKGAVTSGKAVSSSSSTAGKLIFDGRFETGNLLSADEIVKEAEYDIKIRPDTNNPRYRVWFYFSVKNARKRQVCGQPVAPSSFRPSPTTQMTHPTFHHSEIALHPLHTTQPGVLS